MPFINVTAEELDSLAAQISSAGSKLNSEQGALLAQIGAMAPGWEGSVGAQFGAVYDQWRTSQLQLLEAMERIAAMLQQASANYRSAEASIANSFSLDSDRPS